MRYDVPLKELFHQAPQQLLQLLMVSLVPTLRVNAIKLRADT